LNPEARVKTAIVLPSCSWFSESQPNSMETVVRTLASNRPRRDDLLIVCDAGAASHGDLPVRLLPPGGGRTRTDKITRALRDFAPDCIEFHQQVKMANAVGPRFPDAIRLLYRHNAIRPPANALDRFRYNRRYAGLDGLIFVSDAGRREFAEAYPKFADRTFGVCNPIDPTGWVAPVENREPLIAFSGRAMPQKGLDVLCEALPAILERWPEWRVSLMLGDWDQHERWAAPHVDRLARFGDRVEVLHSVPLARVRDVMTRAAIAIAPSVWAEPLGLTALEAHAAGAALISSGRGGLREASGPHALYLDDVTPEAIIQATNTLIVAPELRTQMARDAQTYVLEVHAPRKRALELDALRGRLLEEKRSLRRTISQPVRLATA